MLDPSEWNLAVAVVLADLEGFADGSFYRATGKARLVPVSSRPPANPRSDEYPLVLNTGRIRDQWHTMTRSARSPRLNKHLPESFVQVHPVDATIHGLADGALAQLTSRWGRMLTRVSVDRDQRPGSLFVPIHWSDAQARQARTDALVNPAVDPVSGQPEFKHTPVRIEAFHAAWCRFMMSRDRLIIDDAEHWVSIKGYGFWRTELAGAKPASDWAAWAHRAIGTDGEWLDFADPSRGSYRGARIVDGRLTGCVFISAAPGLPRSSWLDGLFAADTLDSRSRASLLAGRPPKGQKDAGEIVCACFNVGQNTIIEAIRGDSLASVDAIGTALRAGTNCGSCIPELSRILERQRQRQGRAA